LFIIQRALPLLRDGGRIINISSSDTRVALPLELAYAMTKGAINVMSQTLANHLGTRGITVNAVAPGPTDTDKTWVDRRLVGGDLDGCDLGRTDGLLEAPPGGLGVPTRGDEHVDDLPELVDCSVDVAPVPSHLRMGLVHEPTVADGVPAGSGGLSQQRCEPEHPPVDRHVVHLDTPLGEELLHVAVGQAEAQVPADRQHDHIRREAEAGQGGTRRDRPA
jgi:Enoyl-(Acyl carrier protein) reductase